MQLYRTIRRNERGEVFYGFTRDPLRSQAFTVRHDFRRIVEATAVDLEGKAQILHYMPNCWLRRIARFLLGGPRLRAVLRVI